jgi:hypothetical protein
MAEQRTRSTAPNRASCTRYISPQRVCAVCRMKRSIAQFDGAQVVCKSCKGRAP